MSSEQSRKGTPREVATVAFQLAEDDEKEEIRELLEDAGYELQECADPVPCDYGVFTIDE